MIRSTFVCSLALVVSALPASAEDCPLTFKTIPAKAVMSFPGGYGSYGSIQLNKPAGLRKEPKAVSRYPLYGRCGDTAGSDGFLFRLDESQGNGKGYDRLIMDLNQNGDLTDDPVVSPAEQPNDRRSTSRTDQTLFGPIVAPEDKAIAGNRPIYFAQTYLYNVALLRQGRDISELGAPIGQLLFKAGWYLDTTVTWKELNQKVGVYDANANLRLGDLSHPQTSTVRGETSWYFQPGDVLLVDANGSSAFENDNFQSESAPFGNVLYLSDIPYEVELASNAKMLRVQPGMAALAEVTLAPHGDQVRNVTLARESKDGKWELLRAGAASGKIKVPPGNYRLYACDLIGKAAPRDQVMAAATQRLVQSPVRFTAGQANTLRCGAPLTIKVTAEKARAETLGRVGISPFDATRDSEFELSINAEIRGAGGELYSTYAKGEQLQARPPKPAFAILDSTGKKLADGNLEYG